MMTLLGLHIVENKKVLLNRSVNLYTRQCNTNYNMVVLPVLALCLKVLENVSVEVDPDILVSDNLLEAPVPHCCRTKAPPVHLGMPVLLELQNA